VLQCVEEGDVETLKRCFVSFSSVCVFIFQHVVSPLLLSLRAFFFKLPTVIVLVVLGSLIEFVDRYSLFAFSLSLVLLFFPTFDRAYDFTHVGNVLDLSSFSDVFINQLLRGERSRRENRYVDNP
jgi:hypothetical protein